MSKIKPPIAKRTYTYRGLINRILADESIDKKRKEDVVSGLRCFVKLVHGQVDGEVPSLPDLRALISEITPKLAGITEGRWRNIRGFLQFALANAGLATVPRRYDLPPSAGWTALLTPLDYPDRYKLSHIARYCTQIGVEPVGVDDALMDKFLADLTERSLKAEPARVHRDATVTWNRLAASRLDWPKQRLSIADNRGYYSLPWDRFPQSLRDDVAAWLERLGTKDFRKRSGFKPLRPASIILRRKQIHEYLSALVLEGVDPAEMFALKDVVTGERARTGMMFFWNRAGEKASVHAGQIVGTILSIARHYAKLSEAEIDDLRALHAEVRVEYKEMTQKNRNLLRPLDDRRVKEDYVLLAETMKQTIVAAGAPTRKLALRMQSAVAVGFLLNFPLRIRNLRELRMGKHFIYGRRKNDLTVFFPTEDVKNGVSLERKMPQSMASLIELYLAKYRPLLDNAHTDWLFPGQCETDPKCAESLRQQIKKITREGCGLKFTPHTFRHATGTVILQDDPGAIALVQRMLGHKNSSTTIKFYAGMETKVAFDHYDTLLDRLGGTSKSPSRRPAQSKSAER